MIVNQLAGQNSIRRKVQFMASEQDTGKCSEQADGKNSHWSLIHHVIAVRGVQQKQSLMSTQRMICATRNPRRLSPVPRRTCGDHTNPLRLHHFASCYFRDNQGLLP